MAHEFLQKVLQAHGGLSRWNCFETVEATIVTGGQLFEMKYARRLNTSPHDGGDEPRMGFGHSLWRG